MQDTLYNVAEKIGAPAVEYVNQNMPAIWNTIVNPEQGMGPGVNMANAVLNTLWRSAQQMGNFYIQQYIRELLATRQGRPFGQVEYNPRFGQ